jgi:hypothetical protein
MCHYPLVHELQQRGHTWQPENYFYITSKVVNINKMTWCAVHSKEDPVGFEVLTVVTMKSINFWDVTAYSLVEVHRDSFERPVNFYQTTQHYTPENGTLQTRSCCRYTVP